MHCVKGVRIRSFSGPYFPDSDWIRRDTPYSHWKSVYRVSNSLKNKKCHLINDEKWSCIVGLRILLSKKKLFVLILWILHQVNQWRNTLSELSVKLLEIRLIIFSIYFFKMPLFSIKIFSVVSARLICL